MIARSPALPEMVFTGWLSRCGAVFEERGISMNFYCRSLAGLLAGGVFFCLSGGDLKPHMEGGTFRLAHVVFPPGTFTGTVEYAKTSVLSFEEKGRIAYVAPVGRYVQSKVVNKNGKMVSRGDLLALQDPEIPTSDVHIAEALLERAESVVQEKKLNYDRDKKLSEKGSVSLKQYQESSMLYETAQLDKKKAALDLQRARQVLDACYIWAPFNAVVEEVYRSDGGSADVGDSVMKICMVDPVKIRVNIPAGTNLEEIQRMSQILVYPSGSKQPVSAWLEGHNPDSGRIDCYVANPQVSEEAVDYDGRPVPVIDNLLMVQFIPEKTDLAALWVPEQAVKKEEGGSFVWRVARPRKDVRVQMISTVARLEKVRVEALDFLLQYGNTELRGIKAGSNLRKYDIVACDVPAGLKDGSTVMYRKKRHLFRIGEKVKVVFTSGNREHIFQVSAQAVAKNGKNGGFFVMAEENGRFRKVPVIVLKNNGGTVRLYSPELKEGILLSGNAAKAAGQ